MSDEVRVRITTEAQLQSAQAAATHLEAILQKTKQNDSAAKEYKQTLDSLNRAISQNTVGHSQEAAELQKIIPLIQSLGIHTQALRGRMKALNEINGANGGSQSVFAQMKSDILGVVEALPGVGGLIGKAFEAATGPVGMFTVAIEGAREAMENFSKTELLWARLDAQLAHSGELFDGNREKYHALMESLADRTLGTTDQQWGQIILRLGQFGRTSQQVAGDAETIRNLAARMGTSIETAAHAYERALNGSFYMLQRYGIMIPQHMSQMEKLKMLNEQLAGSQSYWNSVNDTAIGSWEEMKKRIERLTDSLGRHLSNISPLRYAYQGIGEAAAALSKLIGGDLPDAVDGMKNQFNTALPTLAEFKEHQDGVNIAVTKTKESVTNLTTALDDYKKKVTETQAEEKKLMELQKTERINRLESEAQRQGWSAERLRSEKAMIEKDYSRREYDSEVSGVTQRAYSTSLAIDTLRRGESTAQTAYGNASDELAKAKASGDPGKIARAERLFQDAATAFKKASDAVATEVPKLTAQLDQFQQDAARIRNNYISTAYSKGVENANATVEGAFSQSMGLLQANPNMPAAQIGRAANRFGRQVDISGGYGNNYQQTGIINAQLGAAGIEELQQFQSEIPKTDKELQTAIFIAIQQKKAMIARLKYIQAKNKGDLKAMGEAEVELEKINADLKTNLAAGNQNGWSYGSRGPVIGSTGAIGFNYNQVAPGYRSFIPQYNMSSIGVTGSVAAALRQQQTALNGAPQNAAFGPGALPPSIPPMAPARLPGDISSTPVPGNVNQSVIPYPPMLDSKGQPSGQRSSANTQAVLGPNGNYIFYDRQTGQQILSTGHPFEPSGSGEAGQGNAGEGAPEPRTRMGRAMETAESAAITAATFLVFSLLFKGGGNAIKRWVGGGHGAEGGHGAGSVAPVAVHGAAPAARAGGGGVIGAIRSRIGSIIAGRGTSGPATATVGGVAGAAAPGAATTAASGLPEWAGKPAFEAPAAGGITGKQGVFSWANKPAFADGGFSSAGAAAHKSYFSFLRSQGYPEEVAQKGADALLAQGTTLSGAPAEKFLLETAKKEMGGAMPEAVYGAGAKVAPVLSDAGSAAHTHYFNFLRQKGYDIKTANAVATEHVNAGQTGVGPAVESSLLKKAHAIDPAVLNTGGDVGVINASGMASSDPLRGNAALKAGAAKASEAPGAVAKAFPALKVPAAVASVLGKPGVASSIKWGGRGLGAAGAILSGYQFVEDMKHAETGYDKLEAYGNLGTAALGFVPGGRLASVGIGVSGAIMDTSTAARGAAESTYGATVGIALSEKQKKAFIQRVVDKGAAATPEERRKAWEYNRLLGIGAGNNLGGFEQTQSVHGFGEGAGGADIAAPVSSGGDSGTGELVRKANETTGATEEAVKGVSGLLDRQIKLLATLNTAVAQGNGRIDDLEKSVNNNRT